MSTADIRELDFAFPSRLVGSQLISTPRKAGTRICHQFPSPVHEYPALLGQEKVIPSENGRETDCNLILQTARLALSHVLRVSIGTKHAEGARPIHFCPQAKKLRCPLAAPGTTAVRLADHIRETSDISRLAVG
jgi:hypothetical protein